MFFYGLPKVYLPVTSEWSKSKENDFPALKQIQIASSFFIGTPSQFLFFTPLPAAGFRKSSNVDVPPPAVSLCVLPLGNVKISKIRLRRFPSCVSVKEYHKYQKMPPEVSISISLKKAHKCQKSTCGGLPLYKRKESPPSVVFLSIPLKERPKCQKNQPRCPPAFLAASPLYGKGVAGKNWLRQPPSSL